MSLFPEIFTSTRKLSNEQFGALIRAGRLYQMEGLEYEGNDIAVDIAFQFLSSQIDRRNEASTKKTEAAKRRWNKKEDAEGMQSDANACRAMQEVCTAMQSDAEGMQSDAQGMHNDAEGMQSNAPIHSIPIHSIPIHSKESKADKPPAPTKQVRKSYGQFGWVKLTDEEYNRLLNDLGQAEVKRCITYVDESAQATGNKNKWRDWNLVIRKCSRDKWGAGVQSRCGKKEIPKGASGELGEAELEAIQRVLREE